jgi:hypothetical protein
MTSWWWEKREKRWHRDLAIETRAYGDCVMRVYPTHALFDFI